MHKLIGYIGITSLVVTLGLDPFCSYAQLTGINFEQGLSWKDVLEKAKKEKKFIFLDCYATWCGPCKWMSRNIFPMKDVGDYFNTHFISVAVQMDRTATDSPVVKDWYDDANALAKEYRIHAYPTYLFFDSNGNAVHYLVGSVKSAEEFISVGKDALNPSAQFFTRINTWSEHAKDTAYLHEALLNALNVMDSTKGNQIATSYFLGMKDLLTEENIRLMARLAQINLSSKSKWFKILQNNSAKINRIMKDSDYVQWNLGWDIVTNEEIAPLFSSNKLHISWLYVSDSIRLKYPMLGKSLVHLMELQFRNYVVLRIRALANGSNKKSIRWRKIENEIKSEIKGFDLDRTLLEEQVTFYAHKKEWSRCSAAAFLLMNKYGAQLGSRAINNLCWDDIFLHCNNRRIMEGALKWMKYDLGLAPNNPNMQDDADTYANLLYKMGYRTEALLWEKRSIELAQMNKSYPHDMDVLKSTLSKMEHGEPTWRTN